MPARGLTNFDLTDPEPPPVPGQQQRAAVQARARQITRRRRSAVGAGLVGIIAIAGLSAAVFTAGSAGTGKVAAVTATIHVVASASTPVSDGSTVTVTIANADGTFTGQSDETGTVQFAEVIPAGTYRVYVSVESAPTPASDADVGTAVITYKSSEMDLQKGVNTLDLSALTPVS
jgi:hypothetical protein